MMKMKLIDKSKHLKDKRKNGRRWKNKWEDNSFWMILLQQFCSPILFKEGEKKTFFFFFSPSFLSCAYPSTGMKYCDVASSGTFHLCNGRKGRETVSKAVKYEPKTGYHGSHSITFNHACGWRKRKRWMKIMSIREGGNSE